MNILAKKTLDDVFKKITTTTNKYTNFPSTGWAMIMYHNIRTFVALSYSFKNAAEYKQTYRDKEVVSIGKYFHLSKK